MCLCPSCVAADPSRATLRLKNRLDLLRRLHAADEEERRDWERLVRERQTAGDVPRERAPRPPRATRRPTTGREPVGKGTMLNMIDDEGQERFEAYEQTLARIAEYTGGELDAESVSPEEYREVLNGFGGADTHDTI